MYYGTSYTTNMMLVGQDQYDVCPADPWPQKLVLYRMNGQLKRLNVSKVDVNHAEMMLLGGRQLVDCVEHGRHAGELLA